MADLKKMKMAELRALARKVLGAGSSRLKTKADIVRALEQAEERVASAAAGAVRAAKAAVAGARQAVKGVRERRAAKAEPEAGKKEAPAAAAPPGPDPEGFFVARVRGEEAARGSPHGTAEGGGERRAPQGGRAARAEGLGELPRAYGDDAFVALARDPRTLFVWWDLSRETLADAFGGPDEPRAQLRVFVRAGSGWDPVRTVDLAVESRGWYVDDLEPGRTYRAEIHAVDRRGRDRMVARPSNEAALPPAGPSPVVDDRFARIPWDAQLGQALGPGRPGGPFSDEARAMLARLSDWARFSTATWGGSAGGLGGRPFSPVAAPSARGRAAEKPPGGDGRR